MPEIFGHLNSSNKTDWTGNDSPAIKLHHFVVFMHQTNYLISCISRGGAHAHAHTDTHRHTHTPARVTGHSTSNADVKHQPFFTSSSSHSHNHRFFHDVIGYLRYIGQLESLRKLEVQLNGGTLVRPTQCVQHSDVNLWGGR